MILKSSSDLVDGEYNKNGLPYLKLNNFRSG
jgi:hypothetical protein